MAWRVGWFGTVPLLALGLFSAHELGYRLALSDPHTRAEALHESGHGYLAHAPLGLSFCLALLVGAFVLRASSVARRRPVRSPGRILALLPPLAFVLQEHLERLLHSGYVPGSLLLEPAFLLGLALQVPLALVVLVLASLLGSLADSIGRAVARRDTPRARHQLRPWRRALEVRLPRARPLALGYAERGPPLSP